MYAALDTPQFSIAEVSDAVGVPVATLRSHLQRQHWRLDGEDFPADAPGKGHLVTMRRALQIGAAAALIRAGVPPATAHAAASSWDGVLPYGFGSCLVVRPGSEPVVTDGTLLVDSWPEGAVCTVVALGLVFDWVTQRLQGWGVVRSLAD